MYSAAVLEGATHRAGTLSGKVAGHAYWDRWSGDRTTSA
jgi:hypothetical protein